MNSLSTQSGMAVSGAATPPDPLDDIDWLLRCEAADEVYSSTGLAEFWDSVTTWSNIAEEPQECSDAVQVTESLQPIYLPKGSNGAYAYFGGITGNSLSIPHDPSFDITGDFTLEYFVQIPTDPSSTSSNYVFSTSESSTNRGIGLSYIRGASFLRHDLRLGSAAGNRTISAPSQSLDSPTWVKITWEQATGTATFYSSPDRTNYTQFAQKTSSTDDITFFDTPAVIGILGNSGLNGRVWNVILQSGIGPSATTVLDVDIPNNAQHGDTTFPATVGGIVTVNSAGTNPTKIIGKSIVRHDGIDDFMEATLDASRSNLHAWFVLQHHTSQNNQRAFSIDSDNLNSPQFDEFAGAYRVGGSSGNWGDVLERNVLEARWSADGTECAFYIDGVAQYISGSPVSFSTLKLFLAGFTSGTFPHAAVDFEAIFVAKGILNNEESAAITEAVNQKYNIY